MQLIHSKKAFYVLTVFVLFSWLAGTFIPAKDCEQRRFGPYDVFHMEVCNNMSAFANSLYSLFTIATLILTAYAIVLALLFLRSEP